MAKTVMFIWGLKGPFEATWNPDTEDCPRVNVGDGTGLVLYDTTPEYAGAKMMAQRYDIHGNRLDDVHIQTV